MPAVTADLVVEQKFDGYRLVAQLQDGRAVLRSRSGLDWTARLQPLARAVEALRCADACLDGELCAFVDGIASFAALQEALAAGQPAGLSYVVFDLMRLRGQSLLDWPLWRRQKALATLLRRRPAASPLRPVVGVRGPLDLAALKQATCAAGMEGLVLKNRFSPYRCGERDPAWIKVACVSRATLAIYGYVTGPRGRLAAILLCEQLADRTWQHRGRLASGLQRLPGAALQRAWRSSRQPAVTSPQTDVRGATFVRPNILVEVEFRAFTPKGQLRHAVLLGLRHDLVVRGALAAPGGEPGDVAAGAPALTPAVQPGRPPAVMRPTAGPRQAGAGDAPRLSHPERQLYAEPPLTKAHLVAYWEKVAPRMLPYVCRRPLALWRIPADDASQGFYQKHLGRGAKAPPGIILYMLPGAKQPCMAVDGLTGLVALAQLGAAELHIWGCTLAASEAPDLLVFDLDPGADVAATTLVRAAKAVRAALQRLGLVSLLKSTGGKGLHVVVPLQPRHGWGEVHRFAAAVARWLQGRHPEIFVVQAAKRLRQGRIYLDIERNRRGATCIAPFSPRARPGVPVAQTVAWSQLIPQLVEAPTTMLGVLAAGPTRRDPWARSAAWQQRLPRP